MNEAGVDAEGQVTYTSPAQLWEASKDASGGHQTWYRRAVEYWDHQEASDDGVLGGFGHLTEFDLKDSEAVLHKAVRSQLEQAAAGKRKLVCIDCGAGIGRVSEGLLLRLFHTVDLLEPSRHLLDSAVARLGADAAAGRFGAGHAPGRSLCMGLQEFTPEAGRYDCIWVQWCLLYLTDDDALAFLDRCKAGLQPDGIIMVKENICKAGFIHDKEDSSLTRSNTYMLELFARAEMRVLYNIKQRNFPANLFAVRMYVLVPGDRA